MLHWAPCMGILTRHSWQFSAISKKCYLILHGHESSVRSCWPCLEWSVPPATQQLGAVSWNKSTKLRYLKCVAQLQLEWWFWCLIYFVAACQCPGKALACTHAPDFCTGPVYLASDPSKAEAFSPSLCSYLHPPQWMCILCHCYLGPWDYSQFAQLPQELTSSLVGILVKILCFQGIWHVNTSNTACSKITYYCRNKETKSQNSDHLNTLLCNGSLTAWITPWAGAGWFQVFSLPAPPLLLCQQTHWQAHEPTRTQDQVITLLSSQPACTDYIAWCGIFSDQRILPYKQKIAKVQWLSSSDAMSSALHSKESL